MAEQQQPDDVVELSEADGGRQRRRRPRPGRIITLAIVFLLLGALSSAATVYAGLLSSFERGIGPVFVNEEDAEWWSRNRPDAFKKDASEQIPMTQFWGSCTLLISEQYMGPEYTEFCYRFRFGFPFEFMEGRVWQIYDYRYPHEVDDSTIEDYAQFLLTDDKKFVRVQNLSEHWIGEPEIVRSPRATTLSLESLPVPARVLLSPTLLNWAFWTSVFLVPFLLATGALRMSRRLIRQCRGQCGRCGYPMGESPRCTECGTPLPRHPR